MESLAGRVLHRSEAEQSIVAPYKEMKAVVDEMVSGISPGGAGGGGPLMGNGYDVQPPPREEVRLTLQHS
jgi:hypothetical protein